MGRPRAYLLLLLCCIYLVHPVHAALPSTLSFQEGIEYNPAQGAVTARGQVVLTYAEGEIHADEAVYLWDEALFLFSGNVVIMQDGEQITASKAQYQGGQLTLAGAAMAQGEFILRAEQVAITQELIVAADGSLTTCDLADPHYQLSAREVRIHPGDKIIVEGAAYREGAVTLYYWPYLIIPLGEEFTLPFPELGRGPGGLFVRTPFHYLLPSGGWGTLHLDYFQREGPAFGLDHIYQRDAKGRGEARFYWKDGLEELAVEHRFYLRDITLGAGFTWDGSWQSHAWLEDEDDFGSINYRQDEFLEVFFNRQGPLHLWGQALWLSDSFQYQARAEKILGDHRIYLAGERMVNPEEDEAWEAVSREPELGWSRSFLGGEIGGALGRYRETPAGVSAWRLMGEGLLWDRSLPIGDMSRIGAGGRIKASSYSTGDGALVGEGRVFIEHAPSPWLLRGQYSRKDVWGRSPFAFDAESPMEELAARIEGAALGLSFSLESGYDLRGRAWLPLQGAASIGGDAWSLTVWGEWGIPSGTLQQAGGLLAIKSRGVAFQGGASYDVVTSSWQELNLAGSLPLGPNLSASLVLDQDLGWEAVLKWHLHCRTVALHYEPGVIWVDYSLGESENLWTYPRDPWEGE